MNTSKTFIVDFIVKSEVVDEWKMVLVEEGEWPHPISDRLRIIQQRLFNCIDAAISGQLAEQFPESKHKKILISIDFYNAPQNEVSEFIARFRKNVFLTAPYKEALEHSTFVKDIGVEANFESL